MRTTVVLDDDVVAALDRLRREKGLGLSEALNQLVRNGLHEREPPPRARLESSDLGLRIDVSNVAEALDFAEGD